MSTQMLHIRLLDGLNENETVCVFQRNNTWVGNLLSDDHSQVSELAVFVQKAAARHGSINLIFENAWTLARFLGDKDPRYQGLRFLVRVAKSHGNPIVETADSLLHSASQTGSLSHLGSGFWPVALRDTTLQVPAIQPLTCRLWRSDRIQWHWCTKSVLEQSAYSYHFVRALAYQKARDDIWRRRPQGLIRPRRGYATWREDFTQFRVEGFESTALIVVPDSPSAPVLGGYTFRGGTADVASKSGWVQDQMVTLYEPSGVALPERCCSTRIAVQPTRVLPLDVAAAGWMNQEASASLIRQ